ncbi:hypothetical protein VTO42DRAFT_2964 [Malbranchea cinnamomea]
MMAGKRGSSSTSEGGRNRDRGVACDLKLLRSSQLRKVIIKKKRFTSALGYPTRQLSRLDALDAWRIFILAQLAYGLLTRTPEQNSLPRAQGFCMGGVIVICRWPNQAISLHGSLTRTAIRSLCIGQIISGGDTGKKDETKLDSSRSVKP